MSDTQQPESPQSRPDRPEGGGEGGFGGGRGQERGFGGGRGPERGFSGPPGPPVDYRSLVEFIARSIAEEPEQVQVNAVERGRGTLLVTVKMADGDIGKLIGKNGRNIEALRSLVRAASLRERKRVFVDLG